MDQTGVSLLLPPSTVSGLTPKSDSPARIRDAARQFEALLINQILHSARESSGGSWLSLGGDTAGDAATDFAEQQLADVLARQGGLGLARMIAAGLKRESGE